MSILTVGKIAEVLGAKLVNADNALDKAIEGAAIDSRKIEKDFLFFAIKGEKSDGHDYIASVFEKGAAAVICNHVPDGVTGPSIVVEDTVKALKELASFYRTELGIKVVGVTGSVGKTTTKEFIATVLSQKYNVFRTEKNQNNLIGLPLSILNIKENNEVAVLEMGISEFGEMRELSSIAKPDICVITNICACHLESLGSLDGVLKAKTEIFEHMNPTGDVCVCGDDERLATVKEVNNKPVLTFGFEDTNDIHPVKIVNRGLWGSEVGVENGAGMFNISVPLAGKHMIMDALAAVSVARLLDLTSEQVAFGISCVKALNGRNNIIQKNEITIIDDCYNASPESMKSALDLLTEAITPKIAILGDMFEQGENEEKVHEEIGEYAIEKEIDKLVCVGALSKKMYEKALVAASVKDKTDVVYFETVDAAKEGLKSIIKKGDTVLLKASNGMKFSNLLDALTAEDAVFEEREKKEEAKEETKSEPAFDASFVDAPDATAGSVDTSTQPVKVKKEKTADQIEKESSLKQILIIAGIVAVVLLAAFITFSVVKHKKYEEATRGKIIFLNNGDVYTKGVFENNVITSGIDPVEWSNVDEYFTDGKYIYHHSFYNATYNYSDLKAKDQGTVGKDINQFDIVKSGFVIYRTNGSLYSLNVDKNETQLIAEDIKEYYIDKKKKNLILLTNDGKLCKKSLGKDSEAEVIDDGVSEVFYINDTFTKKVYSKNGSLYAQFKKKEAVKVTDNFSYVNVPENEKDLKIYYNDSDRKVYYYKAGDKAPTLVSEGAYNTDGSELGYAVFFLNDCSKFVVDKKEFDTDLSSVASNPEVVGIDTKKKKVYFVANDNDNLSDKSLFSVSYKALKKGKITREITNIVSVEYADKDCVLVCKKDGQGGTDLYKGDNLLARNVQPGSLKKTVYGDGFVFAYQVSDGDGFYKLVVYDGKHLNDVGSSLKYDFVALSKKKIYFLSKSDTMFEIKEFNGKKAKTYVENITDFKYLQY